MKRCGDFINAASALSEGILFGMEGNRAPGREASVIVADIVEKRRKIRQGERLDAFINGQGGDFRPVEGMPYKQVD